VSERVRLRPGSGNAFRDLGFPQDEAQALALRSALMISIEKVVTGSGYTRATTARRLGLAKLRLDALLQGKLDQFDLDALVTMAARAGLRVSLGIVRQRDVLGRPSFREAQRGRQSHSGKRPGCNSSRNSSHGMHRTPSRSSRSLPR